MWSSFTSSERKIVLGLIAVFMFGGGVELVRQFTRQTAIFSAGPSNAPVAAVPAHAPQTFASNGSAMPSAPTAADPDLIDLNTASAELLEALPGIGPSLAGAIVLDRTANGPFHSVEELDRVKGVGPALLAKVRDQVTVTVPTFSSVAPTTLVAQPAIPPAATQQHGVSPGQVAAVPAPAAQGIAGNPGIRPPVNINTASMEELETLDGIGPSKAGAIIDHRTRNGPFQTPDRITDVRGIGPKTYQANKHRIVVR